MHRKFDNLLVITGFLLYQPKMFAAHQGLPAFMEQVNLDYSKMGTTDPMVQGLVWPALYDYPDGPMTIGKQLVRVNIRTTVNLVLP